MRLKAHSGPLTAMASAVLFGASTPMAKLLLGNGVSPWLLAGLLYAGSGLGLAVLRLALSASGLPQQETGLERRDWPWLGLVVLTGGVLGPCLLMLGLSYTSAATASLLLNVEGLATMGIAWIVFRENVDRRLLIGAFAILASAVLLSWTGGPARGGLGSLAIIGACLAWGIDNNLTRKLSSADPVQIAMVKGIAAGAVNLALAVVVTGARLPTGTVILESGIVGFLGYGMSLVLFVLALRQLGSARTGAYFSTAPFIGAALAVGFLGNPVTWQLVVAVVLMGIGLYLHLAERHEHAHTHEAMEHSHRHRHDEHHQHVHGADDPPGEPHAHRHRHGPLTHKHAHYPDIHHRHRHPH